MVSLPSSVPEGPSILSSQTDLLSSANEKNSRELAKGSRNLFFFFNSFQPVFFYFPRKPQLNSLSLSLVQPHSFPPGLFPWPLLSVSPGRGKHQPPTSNWLGLRSGHPDRLCYFYLSVRRKWWLLSLSKIVLNNSSMLWHHAEINTLLGTLTKAPR